MKEKKDIRKYLNEISKAQQNGFLFDSYFVQTDISSRIEKATQKNAIFKNDQQFNLDTTTVRNPSPCQRFPGQTGQ